MYNSFLSFIIALTLTRNSEDTRNCCCLASYPSPKNLILSTLSRTGNHPSSETQGQRVGIGDIHCKFWEL